MSSVKRCVQCGMLKEADAFRKYTYSKQKETAGRYRICRECEAINIAYTRAKNYVENEERSNSAEYYDKCAETVKRTEQLYELLLSRGFRIPVHEKKEETTDRLEKLMAFYSEPVVRGRSTVDIPQDTIAPKQEEYTAVVPAVIPDELSQWLAADAQTWRDNNISPEYLQETIYESLKAKYRPQIGIDKETYLPIYDDTYKSMLNAILKRFDDYEEECSLAEEESNG